MDEIKLKVPSSLLLRKGFTFAMFYYFVYTIQKPLAEGSPLVLEKLDGGVTIVPDDQINVVNILVFGNHRGDNETLNPKGKGFNCSKVANGATIRFFIRDKFQHPGNYSFDKHFRDSLQLPHMEDVVRSLQSIFTACPNLIEHLNLLDKISTSPINKEGEITEVDDQIQFLTDALRLAVMNSDTRDTLSDDEKTFFSNVYNSIGIKEQISFIYDTSPNTFSFPENTTFASEGNDHELLWQAGRHWFEQSTSSNGRFGNLDINNALFPNLRKKPSFEQAYAVCAKQQDTDGEKVPLMDALSQTSTKHLYLVGEGGSGKTSALFNHMKEYYSQTYDRTHPIPLYIDLSTAPDVYEKLYENGVSSFILRSIHKQLEDSQLVRLRSQTTTPQGFKMLDDAFTKDASVAVDPIWKLLSKVTEQPEVVLLLDGLNECSRTIIVNRQSVVQMIIREINTLANHCPNVRLVLTGRVDENAISSDEISRFLLCGLDDKIIRQHLLDHNWSEEQVIAVAKNKQLMETLRLPLFLSLFTDLFDVHSEILTRGELLRIYFHERTLKPIYYTLQNRVHAIAKGLRDAVHAEPNRISPEIQYFILDFVLPEIAWHMVKYNLFSVEKYSIVKMLMPLFSSFYSDNRYIFQEYRPKQYGRIDPAEVVAELKDIFGEGYGNVVNGVVDLASSTLGILVCEKHTHYRFYHQHIRDYFASRKIINVMCIAGFLHAKNETDEAFASLAHVLADEPLDYFLRTFIGEALGEHRNVPQCIDGCWTYWSTLVSKEEQRYRSLLDQMLDVCRDIQGSKTGYTVYNLLQILKETRKDLSGVCLDRLDLRKVTLNKVLLSRPGLPVKLNGAILFKENLFQMGHTSNIVSAVYHPKNENNTVLTASHDGTAKIWDAATGICKGTIDGHSGRLRRAVYDPTGSLIATASEDRTVKIWDAEHLACIDTLLGHEDHVNDVTFSNDGSLIATASHRTVKLWRREDKKFVCFYSLDGHSAPINSIQFHPTKNLLLTVSGFFHLKVWNLDTYQDTNKVVDGRVLSATYSLDGHQIILDYIKEASCVETVILDSDTYHPIAYTSQDIASIQTVQYVLKWKALLTSGTNHYSLEKGANEKLASLFSTASLPLEVAHWACFSPDGKRFVMSCNSSARIFEMDTATHVMSLQGASSYVQTAAYSPDGKFIVTSSDDGAAKIWDAEAYVCKYSLWGHEGSVYSAAYTSHAGDGQVITASSDGTVRIWNGRTLECTDVLPNKSLISCAPCSWDRDQTIVMDGVPLSQWEDKYNYCDCFNAKNETVGENDIVHFWSEEHQSCLDKLYTHDEDINSATFSHDRTRIVTITWNGTIQVFNIAADKRLKKCGPAFEEHTGYVNCAVFSPDDRCILAACYDGKVKIFDVETHTCLHTFSNVPGLFIQGVDLSKLKLGKDKFSDEDWRILGMYGAIID